jgi:hypothetical protein
VVGDTSTELSNLVREVCRRIQDRLVREDSVHRLTVHVGKIDLFPVRSELVVAVHEAEEVQDHTGVTHVETKSEVRAVYRDAPTISLWLTARGCPTVRICLHSSGVGGLCGSRTVTGLTSKNSLSHLGGEVAKSRIVTITILVIITRRTGAFLRSRRAPIRKTHRSTWNLDG